MYYFYYFYFIKKKYEIADYSVSVLHVLQWFSGLLKRTAICSIEQNGSQQAINNYLKNEYKKTIITTTTKISRSTRRM